MKVKIESILFLWSEAIPTLFLDLVNTLVLTRNEEELKKTIEIMAGRTALDDFFAYGYGSSHFWMRQRMSRRSQYCHDERLLIVEF